MPQKLGEAFKLSEKICCRLFSLAHEAVSLIDTTGGNLFLSVALFNVKPRSDTLTHAQEKTKITSMRD